MKAEGIIKQICNKYISNDALTYEAKNTVYQLEQDLIEEIKTELNPNYYEQERLLLRLIGWK